MRKINLLVLMLFCFDLSAQSECGIHPKAQELAKILMNSSQQLRPKLACNSKLAQAANAKARLMAESKRVDHIINRQTPNQLLKSYGIDLPNIYEPVGNQVEAISGGKESAQSAYEYFMTSPPHKAHLLGENDFYKNQNVMAVGYYYDFYTPHEHYWVVYVTALEGEDMSQFSYNDVPSK